MKLLCLWLSWFSFLNRHSNRTCFNFNLIWKFIIKIQWKIRHEFNSFRFILIHTANIWVNRTHTSIKNLYLIIKRPKILKVHRINFFWLCFHFFWTYWVTWKRDVCRIRPLFRRTTRKSLIPKNIPAISLYLNNRKSLIKVLNPKHPSMCLIDIQW